MARALRAGAPVELPQARKQVRDPDTKSWRASRTNDPKNLPHRYRVQAEGRLHTGELVAVDMVGANKVDVRDAAKTKLNDLIAASNPKSSAPTSTVGALALQWLSDSIQAKWAKSTATLYAYSARRWLVPGEDPTEWSPLAKLDAHEVVPQDVTDWLFDVAVRGGVETADTARSVISAVFKFGLAKRVCTFNPSRDAEAPDRRVVAEAKRREAAASTEPVAKKPGPGDDLDSERAFSGPELDRVLEAFETDPVAVSWDLTELPLFLSAANVRIGGALAALWDDLDLDCSAWARAQGLDPNRAWFRTGEYTIGRVKSEGLARVLYGATKREVRHLALAPWCVEMLLERRARMAGRSALVFDNPLRHGKPREVSATTKVMRQVFDRVLDDDGLPMTWASSHTFRRTGLTALHVAGVPDRTIADHSGHRRLQVLQDHYFARHKVSTTAADHLVDPRTGIYISDSGRDSQVKNR